MTIEPDRNPAQEAPRFLRIETAGTRPQRVRLAEREKIIPALNQAVAAQDPDLILTQNGDDWLFPFLLGIENERTDAGQEEKLAISRDPEHGVRQKKETARVRCSLCLKRVPAHFPLCMALVLPDRWLDRKSVV